MIDECRVAIVGVSGETRRANFSVGFLCSAAVHGLVLLLFLLMRDGAATTLVIPLDVIVVADQSAGPPPPDPAVEPQKEVEAAASPAAVPLGILPSDEHPDDLDLKLQRLAKLRQPDIDTRLSKSDANPSHVSPMSNNAAGDSYAVSDVIRAQVERRWGPDLAALGDKTYSVLIRVEITGEGVVTKAEIVNDSRFAADKAYREIARSARNAVLLSSPFALPSGHYSGVMDLTLSLNTKDALR
jgi:outer membrane biosynthesis protein TonB